MEYVLVNDDCSTCRYVTAAFNLLQLPLRKLALNEFNPKSIQHAFAIFACDQHITNTKKQVYEMMNIIKIPFILLSVPFKLPQDVDSKVYFLRPAFNNYELKDTLLRCAQYDHATEYTESAIFNKFVGKSKSISKIKALISQVADSDTTVLILGQSGTGKDVVASCIHQLSKRKNEPFVPVNCGAIPSELIESELFGHEKGSFTGAITRRCGRFEMADKGSLFLDEIGDMPLQMQVKLLRVLQDNKIERVGGTNSIDVNIRLITATNKSLEQLIHDNLFREDLYYRINVFPIHLPSLAERQEDIPLLIDYYVEKISERLKHRVEFTDKAKDILCHYNWPGNIRELQNFLERMVILFPDHVVDEKEIDPMYKKCKTCNTTSATHLLPSAPVNIKEYLLILEKRLIEEALLQTNGIVDLAAKYLSMRQKMFVEKMKKYKIHISKYSTEITS